MSRVFFEISGECFPLRGLMYSYKSSMTAENRVYHTNGTKAQLSSSNQHFEKPKALIKMLRHCNLNIRYFS